MNEPLRVLLVEDSPSDGKLVLAALSPLRRPILHQRVEDAATMRAVLKQRPFDLVISDWSLPRFSGPAALALLKSMALDLPFIIVSGTVGEEAAVEAMRAGAHDYVLKDKLARLVPVVERELREQEGRSARLRAEAALRQSEHALRDSSEQLRQAQKMEAVGRLAGGVAHDFNNLLSVILGLGQMIMDDLRPGDPLRGDIGDIVEAGQRAAVLTRQLLMFSRQQVLEPRVLDLNELISSVDRMLSRIVGEDVELVAVTAKSLGKVRADSGSLEQVIMNLAVNARDAMPNGGKLTLETANVMVDETFVEGHLGAQVGPHVMLAVSDTGVGMDRATQARIFEPFFTTKGHGKGTGLGLSTVFGIVQQSGGHIWVYSEPGRGATFKIYLPQVDASAIDQRMPHAAPISLRGSETVLVVEDETRLRAVVRLLLQRSGYQVLEASNGGEALLVSERHPDKIHLLLSDVVMPHLSGPELAQRMVLQRPELRVLYMSGYTDDAAVRHGVIGAGTAYLQKPITIESLTRKVREVLDAPARPAPEPGSIPPT